MGCEGGVTIYDAGKIEENFGADVWERTGWGQEHSMPLVETGAERLIVTDWSAGTGNDREDYFEEAYYAKLTPKGRVVEGVWDINVWHLRLRDVPFAVEVARWAVDNARIARVETWT